MDRLAVQLGWVDKVGGTEFVGPFFLLVVDVDDDDLAGTVLNGTLDDGETDAARSEDGDVGSLLDLGGDDGSTVTGGDTAAQQARPVHGGLVGDGDHRDVGHDGVLGEGRGSHKVQEVLALALESGCAVGHDTSSLGGSNLAAQVGLAGFAELALFAFRCANPQESDGCRFRRRGRGVLVFFFNVLESNDRVAGLDVGHTLAD